MKRAENLLSAGRVRAMSVMPYVSSVLLSMEPVKRPGLGTFAVDQRWRMYWDPEMILTWSVSEVAAVWLHESGHPMRMHSARFKATGDPDVNHLDWNRAGDAAINADLREAFSGYVPPSGSNTEKVSLPGAPWYPERIPNGQEGMITEELYRLLRANKPVVRPKQPKPPRLRFLPSRLRYDYALPQAIVAQSSVAGVLTGPVQVHVLDENEQPVSGAVANTTVLDSRTVAFDLAVTLPQGPHVVRVSCAGTDIDGTLEIVDPSVRVTPDHLPQGYAAPAKITVQASYVTFDSATTVTMLDEDRQLVPNAVLDVQDAGPDHLTFAVPTLPSGMYIVQVTSGPDVCEAPLPIGLPHLMLLPQCLPSGYVSPVTVLAEADDIIFDSTTTVQVLDPIAGLQAIAGAVSGMSLSGVRSLRFQLTVDLPDGQYVVSATSGSVTAMAILTVGGDSDGDGDSADSGDSDNDGNGDSSSGEEDTEEGSGEGDSGGGFGGNCGSAADGKRRDYEIAGDEGGISEGRADLIRRVTAQAIKEASKTRGSVPAGLVRWSEAVLDPKVDWRTELRSKVRRGIASIVGKSDYTFSRPSRRNGSSGGVVFPALREVPPPEIAFVFDTSQSVSDGLAADILTEVKGVLRTIGVTGKCLHFIPTDAQTYGVQKINRVAQAGLHGGGGTDMRVGITRALEIKPRPGIIIVGTDGYTLWPETQPPGVTVIGLLVGDSPPKTPDWIKRIVIDS